MTRRSYETDESLASRLDHDPPEQWEVRRAVTNGATKLRFCVSGDGRKIALANGLCAECGDALDARLAAAVRSAS